MNKPKAHKRYRQFVREGIHKGSPWSELQGQVLLGEEDFIDRYKDLLSDKEPVKEIPRPQRYISRPSLTRLLLKEDTGARRNKRIHTAHVKHGDILKEIADHLGIHYTTVSKAIKRNEEK
ncbi:MAG TPA: hypothetical protein VK654_04565 [Nitrospirota bacterium]|nr:hypothetical protein [Nitrospirota bacterium]